MTFYFLQESKEKNKFKIKIKNILNKIEEKTDENMVFLSLPIKIVGAHDCALKIAKEIKAKKIKKLMKKMEKYNLKTVILSENLYKIEKLKNMLYSRNINILDGNYLFKMLAEETIKYICIKTKKNIEKIEVSILMNDINNINNEIIVDLAEKVKKLNIVTNHIDKFKELEEYLYNEKGIIVRVTNNYKTALQKTEIILNIDFPEETINKYSIYSKSIIINMNGKIRIKSKKFNGININNYNIIIPKGYKIEGFDDKFIYEGYIFNKDYKTSRQHIIEDKIQIKNLVGENGEINNREFYFFP